MRPYLTHIVKLHRIIHIGFNQLAQCMVWFYHFKFSWFEDLSMCFITTSFYFKVLHLDWYCSKWSQKCFFSKSNVAFRRVEWTLNYTNVFIWKRLLPLLYRPGGCFWKYKNKKMNVKLNKHLLLMVPTLGPFYYPCKNLLTHLTATECREVATDMPSSNRKTHWQRAVHSRLKGRW